MNESIGVVRLVSKALALALLSASLASQEFPKMDESWTVMVNGQVVPVEPDGSFVIPNVSAPDQFGPGGPGTRPDFVSDDLLRVVGISSAGGVMRYAFSDRFQFRAGQAFSVGEMILSDDPPPFPQSIVAMPDAPVLTALAEQTTVRVIGTLLGGSQVDVTSQQSGTTYRTSNPGVLTIDQDGVATAISAGTAFVTALNEGATAVAQLVVVPGDPLTEVIGLVEMEDGSRAQGATVTVLGQGLSTMTLADGSFSIPMAATQLGQISVSAILGNMRGVSSPVEPMPGMMTDAGIITLFPVQDVLVFGDRGERFALESELIALGRVVVNQQSLPGDLSSFGTIWHVGAFSALSPSEQTRLSDFVAAGGGLHLTGERPCCETLNASLQTLINSLVVGGGVQVGNLGDIPGPFPFNPDALNGISVTPNLLGNWQPNGPGGVGGLGALPDENILVTGATQPVGAVWDCADLTGGAGHLTILMDVNWLSNSARAPVIENIQTFLELGVCSPASMRSASDPARSRSQRTAQEVK